MRDKAVDWDIEALNQYGGYQEPWFAISDTQEKLLQLCGVYSRWEIENKKQSYQLSNQKFVYNSEKIDWELDRKKNNFLVKEKIEFEF